MSNLSQMYFLEQMNNMFESKKRGLDSNSVISEPPQTNQQVELSSISKITDGLYLSGVFAIDSQYQIIKKLGIKFILCCVDRDYVNDIHDKILLDNPDLTILYLPYNDDTFQNLWKVNKGDINLIKYMANPNHYDGTMKDLSYYKDRTMIEIGYHFIDSVISNNQSVLVHCMAGISRSASVVIYYLMKKYHLSYKEAAALVKSKRSIANPNDSFQLQLKRYEVMRDKMREEHAKEIIDSFKKMDSRRYSKKIIF